MAWVNSVEQLAAIYGEPVEAATVKVTQELTEDYCRFVQRSPFLTLATAGPEGLDCSPRGDRTGFVRIVNPRQVQLPDRRGNNRVDSLRNIVRDPRVALLFFVPGCDTTLRLNGTAHICTDEELLQSFAVDRHEPRSVIVIDIQQVYFQCGRALLRSELWNPDQHVAKGTLPTPGEILAHLTDDRVGGRTYDEQWPERAP